MDSSVFSRKQKTMKNCFSTRKSTPPGDRKVQGFKTNLHRKGDRSAVTIEVGRLSKEDTYLNDLLRTGKYFYLASVNSIALSECCDDGTLGKRYFVCEELKFTETSTGKVENIFVCSCDESSAQTERLKITKREVVSLQSFLLSERKVNCIHSKMCQRLPTNASWNNPTNDTFSQDDRDADVVQQLSLDPFLVALLVHNNIGIITRVASKIGGSSAFRCLVCKHHINSCQHIDIYRDWLTDNNLQEEQLDADTHINVGATDRPSISKESIPYPFDEDMKKTYDDYESQFSSFPSTLVPPVTEETCEHGNTFSSEDPIQKKWIVTSNAKIFKKSITIKNVSICYRPSEGDCGCKLMYDGKCDLLFNLDNKNIFYYGLLLDYLHSMVESKCPLASFHRTAVRTSSVASNSSVVGYTALRLAWNAFSHLLSINMESSFKCSLCGDHPKTVVCDGIMMGFRRDLAPAITHAVTTDLQEIAGTKHSERVYVAATRLSRKLFQEYCGITDGRYTTSWNGITKSQFDELISSVQKLKPDFAKLLKANHRGRHARYKCPEGLRHFVGEITRNTPLSGVFQTSADHSLVDDIENVLNTGTDIRDHANKDVLQRMQSYLPIMARVLSTDVSETLNLVIKEILVQLKKQPTEVPPEECYGTCEPEKWYEFFPNHREMRGDGNYTADKRTNDQEGSCRKETMSHPKLTPGLFTVFCPHGISLGFSAMLSCESPKMPFSLFTRRFEPPPGIIVYDNACKLHAYALNREPGRFAHTIFYVDRLHFRQGHKGCTLGYSLDEYKGNIELKKLNYQANEQANSGLRRIQTQLAYMKAENFMHTTPSQKLVILAYDHDQNWKENIYGIL